MMGSQSGDGDQPRDRLSTFAVDIDARIRGIDVRVGRRAVWTDRLDLEPHEVAFLIGEPRAAVHRRLDPGANGRYPLGDVIRAIEDDGLALAFLVRILQARYVAPRTDSDTTPPPSLIERLEDLL